jgi:hypothetical protein
MNTLEKFYIYKTRKQGTQQNDAYTGTHSWTKYTIAGSLHSPTPCPPSFSTQSPLPSQLFGLTRPRLLHFAAPLNHSKYVSNIPFSFHIHCP